MVKRLSTMRETWVRPLGSTPGLGRFSREGNGNPLQYSCLENPTDGGAWCPWGRKQLDMTEQVRAVEGISSLEATGHMPLSSNAQFLRQISP